MNESDLLIGIAELGVGIAGFGGIFYAVVATDRRDGWMRNYLLGVLNNCFSVVLLAVFATAIIQFQEEPWGWVSLFAVIYGVILSIVHVRVMRVVVNETTRVPPWARSIGILTTILGVGGLLVHVANLPIFAFANFGVFYFAMCMTLACAMVQFIYIVFCVSIAGTKPGGAT